MTDVLPAEPLRWTDAHSSHPIVQLRGVSAVDGDLVPVDRLSLEVPAGSVTALVGPNGAGKSTLLRMLAGLKVQSSGRLVVLGERPGAPAALAGIRYVGQTKPLYAGFTVREMLKFARLSNRVWDGSFAAARLDDLGVPMRRRVGSLSGGQRTQVALTLALATRPRLLILDEALSELDPVARVDVISLLMSELVDRDLTIIVSSHSISEAESFCDRLILLRQGKAVLSESVEHLLASHMVASGPVELVQDLEQRYDVVDVTTAGRQAAVVLRSGLGSLRFLDRRWVLVPAGLEQIVLGHLRARRPLIKV